MGSTRDPLGRSCRTSKLQPELVPQPLWGISAYRLLRRGASWKVIRAAELERGGHRCAACGATAPPFICHEEWRYGDRKRVATLTGFGILCRDCNRAIHMGRAPAHGELAEAVAQLCRVNGSTEEEAKRMFERALATWEKRGRKHWRVVVAPKLLRIYPQLRVLMGLDTRRVKPTA